jgi:hypothetical protein
MFAEAGIRTETRRNERGPYQPMSLRLYIDIMPNNDLCPKTAPKAREKLIPHKVYFTRRMSPSACRGLLRATLETGLGQVVQQSQFGRG